MATGLTPAIPKEHKVADKVAAQGEWLKGNRPSCRNVIR